MNRMIVKLIVLAIIAYSCKEIKETIPYTGMKTPKPLHVQIDSVATGDGFGYSAALFEFQGKLHFLNTETGELTIYTADMEVEKEIWGIGQGPAEVPRKNMTFVRALQDSIILIGASYDYYVFDKDYNRIASKFLRWGNYSPPEFKNASKKKDLTNPYWYNLSYFYGGFEVIHNKMLIGIEVPHPMVTSFNYYKEDFYYQANNIISFNEQDGEYQKLLGEYPVSFITNPEYRMLNLSFFNKADKNQLYQFYTMDSLIYVYDVEKNRYINSFGVAGKLGNTVNKLVEYRHLEDLEQFRQDRAEGKYGFYTSGFYDKSNDRFFRMYLKSSENPETFPDFYCQVYEHQNYIGEFLANRFTRIAAQLGGDLFALNDNTNEEAIIYRIRISYE